MSTHDSDVLSLLPVADHNRRQFFVTKLAARRLMEHFKKHGA